MISIYQDNSYSYLSLAIYLLVEYDDASLLTLYDGQLTSSTQLLTLNYLVILSHRRSATVSSKTYPLYLLKLIDV